MKNPEITTEHIQEALDLAASYQLTAKDILRLEVQPDGRLASITVKASLPRAPKIAFLARLRPKPPRPERPPDRILIPGFVAALGMLVLP